MPGATVATLIARLEAQTRDFDRNITNSERRLRDLEGSAGRAGAGVQRMGNLMRGAAALGLVAFGKELFDLGVQVQAWGRRFDTVFGGAGAGLTAWTEEMNERLGVSAERLQGTAAAVGDLFVPMGFARREAANLTQEVLTLSAALSEWTGGTVSATDAANIITRAILGEREALIALGVKISEADVQARLLAKGQQDLTGAALEQARAMATLELITQKSKDAMTAFGEGGSEAMRASNALKASMDELKITLSDVLVEIAPLISATAQLVGLLSTPFRPHTVDGILATRDALLDMSAAQLEAARTNGMLYDQLLRTLLLLGGKDFDAKGRTFGPKGLSTPNFQGSNHSGGMVPGPSGATVPIMAMAGERVVPAGLSSGGGSGVTVIVNVAGSVQSERDLAETIRQRLRGERIRGGSLEL